MRSKIVPESEKVSTNASLEADGCTNILWQNLGNGNWEVSYELPARAATRSVNTASFEAVPIELAEATPAPDNIPIAEAMPAAGPQPARLAGTDVEHLTDNDAIIPPFSVQNVRTMFPVSALDNIRANLPLVLQALQARGLTEQTMVLYALATIRVETGDFTPKDEKGSDAYFSRYDHIGGNQGPDDGKRFKGRGLIQLTGRANYTTFGRKLGIDLVGSPDLANEPSNAAEIFAEFLESRATKIRSALANGDLAAARKQVNGGTNGLETLRTAYQEGESLLTAIA